MPAKTRISPNETISTRQRLPLPGSVRRAGTSCLGAAGTATVTRPEGWVAAIEGPSATTLRLLAIGTTIRGRAPFESCSCCSSFEVSNRGLGGAATVTTEGGAVRSEVIETGEASNNKSASSSSSGQLAALRSSQKSLTDWYRDSGRVWVACCSTLSTASAQGRSAT